VSLARTVEVLPLKAKLAARQLAPLTASLLSGKLGVLARSPVVREAP